MDHLHARGSPSATTLLHEAHVEMSERGGASFPDRARFMGYAARVMRGLMSTTRARHAQKRDGLVQITPLDTMIPDTLADPVELTRIGDALDDVRKRCSPPA